MELKRLGNKLILRIDRGEEIVATLKQVCSENGIKVGTVSGLGAVGKATLGLFEVNTKQYHTKEFEGDFEIVSLIGNVSTMDGDTYLHLHMAIGDKKFNVYGGHLTDAHVSVTCEVTIDIIEGNVDRMYNEEVGVNVYKF